MMSLLDDIDKIISALKRRQASLLGVRISGAFVAGFKTAPGKPQISTLQKNAIRSLTKEQFGYLAQFDDALGEELRGKVKGMMAENKGMKEIKDELVPYVQEIFGEEGRVTIDRVGETKRMVTVLQDGTLRSEEKTITRTYTTNTKAYADMLSRTSVHAATSRGRIEGYKAAGVEKWQYVAVPDERVRADHIALSGQVFEIGTIDEELALQKLSEPNCRCRQIPYFDDPELNTDETVYEKQKDDAGLIWQDGSWAFKDQTIMSFNENHDERGRFATGEGGGGSVGGKIKHILKPAKANEFKEAKKQLPDRQKPR